MTPEELVCSAEDFLRSCLVCGGEAGDRVKRSFLLRAIHVLRMIIF